MDDVPTEDAFYIKLLGLRPYWPGGMESDASDWSSMQLPDGGDWVEYMTAKGPEKTGTQRPCPRTPQAVLDHFALASQTSSTPTISSSNAMP